MKYTVVTTSLADDQLAKLWLRATDRQSVADAYDRIEAMLKHDPHSLGREHPGGWRVLDEPPIVVTFRVIEEDRLARILSVHFRP
jgi:hypothetical protein